MAACPADEDRARYRRVHRISSRVRDDRDTPLVWDETNGDIDCFEQKGNKNLYSIGSTEGSPKVSGDEVGDLRLRRSAKPANGVLKDPVCIGDAMVLPEMLKPRCNHEGLEEASALGRILENVPEIGAVLPALLTQIPDGAQERVALIGGDTILDRDQYQTPIGVGFDRQEGRWPMHRRCEIQSCTGLKLPTPGQRDSDKRARGRDEVR